MQPQVKSWGSESGEAESKEAESRARRFEGETRIEGEARERAGEETEKKF